MGGEEMKAIWKENILRSLTVKKSWEMDSWKDLRVKKDLLCLFWSWGIFLSYHGNKWKNWKQYTESRKAKGKGGEDRECK